jgi:GNAT superfamily N-acetyltransferase
MTREDLRIREVRDDELDVVASLTVDAYGEYAARMSPDAWSSFAVDIANVRGRMESAEILVAERDGKLVGSLTRYPDWRGAQEGSVAVRILAVPPEERGAGIGRALMQHAIDRSRTEGKSRVILTTTPDMTPVRELCESLGFRREPGLDHMPAPGVHAQGYALDLDVD